LRFVEDMGQPRPPSPNLGRETGQLIYVETIK
jgi:hypothetical protein